jgi:anti-sigma regulatory factor (Ser/Thr protein kinase)
MHEVRQFAADLASVAVARAWLAAELRDLVPGAPLDDAQLCLSELATNAVRHASSGFEVAIEGCDDRVRITVSDAGDDRPVLQQADRRSPSGRGLLIVDAVSLDWGVTDLEPVGKAVWCELALAARAEADAAPRSSRRI